MGLGPEVRCEFPGPRATIHGRQIEPQADRHVLRPGSMPTDAQLLARISSDATGEALRALYRSYAGELYGFALNALGDRGTAEEVVQEVFTRAWRHAEAYDPTRGSVRTWLYQIARHAIIDTRRRAAVRPALALHEPRDEQDPEGLSIERAMLGWQVAGALEQAHARASPGDPPRPRPGTVGAGDRGAARAARGDRQEPHVVRAAFAAAGLGRDGGAGMTHVHEDIGAYVLGGAGRRCRGARARALADVPGVRGAHAELAGLPALLDLAVVTGATDDEPLPPAIEERLLDRFARERAERPQRRRWRPRLVFGARRRAGRRGGRRRRAGRSASTSARRRPPAVAVPARVRAVGAAPANASARAGLRTSQGGTVVRLWVNNLPRAGDVYEVLLRRAGLERERGHVPRRRPGQRLRDPDDRGQEGPVRPIRVVRREHLGSGEIQTPDILAAKLSLNRARPATRIPS